jgi:hypothetical protein
LVTRNINSSNTRHLSVQNKVDSKASLNFQFFGSSLFIVVALTTEELALNLSDWDENLSKK